MITPAGKGPFRHMVRQAISGATLGLTTTVVSCTLAIGIERAANKTLYKLFPHWYKDVNYAYGVTDQRLSDVDKITTWSI